MPEEYNSFVMMIFARVEPASVDDIESLLIVQDSQFEKFRQELPSSFVSLNVAQAPSVGDSSTHNTHIEFTSNRGGY